MACHFFVLVLVCMENIERRSHSFQGARLGRQFSQASMRFALSLAKKKQKNLDRDFFSQRARNICARGHFPSFFPLHSLAAQGEILELLLERSKKTKKAPISLFFACVFTSVSRTIFAFFSFSSFVPRGLFPLSPFPGRE